MKANSLASSPRKRYGVRDGMCFTNVASMIAIAVLALVVCHPGPMFRAKQRLAAARQQSGDAETQMSESKI